MAVPTRLFQLFIALSLARCSFAQQQNVSIRFVQDDEVHTIHEGDSSLILEQKSFKIQVLLQQVRGVYVFASFGDSLFRLPGNRDVPGFSELPDRAMAESEFNKEKELLVDDKGWSYWFYDPGLHWHRFNKKITLLDSGRVVGTKSIKQLYLVEEERSVKLKDNIRPLYLFFVAAADEDGKGRPGHELLRRKIKIEWRDED